jgi:flagellar L-ring protein precursor FlgH
MLNRFFLVLCIFSLCSCSETWNRIKNIGRPPTLSKLEIPITKDDEDGVTQEDRAKTMQDHTRKTNSLWHPGGTSFFRDNRAWKVGDIVRVVVSIQDSANLNNATQNQRNSSTNVEANKVFGKEKGIAKFLSRTGVPGTLLDAGGAGKHSGSGSISRKENITTVIAATVIKILPNSNLVIQGQQEVRVNSELREVKVAGIIRPKDISKGNSITSDQIAEARISYGGRGVVTNVQDPKIGAQIVDTISPF